MTPRHVLLIAAALCLASVAAPAAAAAQVVTGTLTSADDDRVLTGAMVVLNDSAGRERARALTDGAGRFTLRAPEFGRYRLGAQLIGYATTESPLLTVGADTLEYAFRVHVDAIELPSIQAASSDRGCERRPDGDDVAVLWTEIRKVLNATEWTSQSGGMSYVVRTYRTTVDPDSSNVIADQRSTVSARARLPFETALPSELADAGFARPDGADLFLLGPDAAVLTSSDFLDGHCFSLAAHDDDAGLIGLAFEPVRTRDGIVDVEGALWVDRASAALILLEYRYTNLPEPLSDHGVTAEVRFEPLENGLWIVDSWWIRGPRLIADLAARAPVQRRGYTEDGGWVLRAHDGTRTVFEPPGASVIEGTITASPGGAPLADARVFLIGTAGEAISNDRGRYRIDRVPAGRYGISFSHLATEELNLPVALDSVTIAEGESITHDFALPQFADILRTLCPTIDEEPLARGLIYGLVSDSAASPVGAVPRAVLAEERRGFLSALTGPRRSYRYGDIVDANGRYYLCWVPVDAPLTVEILSNGRVRAAAEVRVPDTNPPLLRLDLELTGR